MAEAIQEGYSSGADDGEDVEEEAEPKLKYERITNDLIDILSNKDAASCMAVHPKFLILGTHWGVVRVLDHLGNSVRKTVNQSSSEALGDYIGYSATDGKHMTTVNQISIDSRGEYIGSCSDDGRVVINGFYSSENNRILNFDRPVKAIALEPNFNRPGSGKQFVTGDEKLMLYEKSFLNPNKKTILHQGEGPIRNIKWCGQFIAWANDMGVKVYDMSPRRIIAFIVRDKDPSFRADMHRCNLFWKNETTLLIGWADAIKICKVRVKDKLPETDVPNRYVEIICDFKIDFNICGIAPFGEDLAVLCCIKEKDGSDVKNDNRPQLHIIKPFREDCENISSDILSVRGFAEYRCNDYHLESIPEESLFYVISPKDVVVAKPRDADDHITWLLSHENYEEAMTAAMFNNGNDLRKHSAKDIGKAYLNHLINHKEYGKAANLCVGLLGKDSELWEEVVYKFAKLKQLKEISPYLPCGDPKLKPTIYELVLNEFLQSDYQGLYQLIKEWPSSLYSVKTVINAVNDKLLNDAENKTLLEVLAELYILSNQSDKALTIYLRLGHKGVFELIFKDNLFNAIKDKIDLLVMFDKEQATKLLLDNIEKIPVEDVVVQLDHKPYFLFYYLDKLCQKDSRLGEKYHGLLVRLYAEFSSDNLLSFLSSSHNYPLQYALEICEQRGFHKEMVFLLDRMGNTKQALRLITEELKDIVRAIEFCKEHNDKDLWKDLIDYSLDKPAFITVLLQNIGTHVDPIILIQKIELEIKIPGLRDSLVKILQDYNLQISLREGCKKILVSDCFNLLEKLYRIQRRGTCIDEEQRCQVCQSRILVGDSQHAKDILIFYCRHTFHADCLSTNRETCSLCNAQQRRPGASSFTHH